MAESRLLRALACPLSFPKTERPSCQKYSRVTCKERSRGHTVSCFTVRREPLSLVNLRKRNLGSGDDDVPPRMDHYKAKATRHIFLIRHSQYHVDASLEKDRTLTPLGTWRELGPRVAPRPASLQVPLGLVSGVSSLDVNIVIVSNSQPVTPGRLWKHLLEQMLQADLRVVVGSRPWRQGPLESSCEWRVLLSLVKTPHGGSCCWWSSKALRGAVPLWPARWQVPPVHPLSLT